MTATAARGEKPSAQMPPASSSVGRQQIPPASSSVSIDPRIAALERERAQKRLRHADLCRMSGVDISTWDELRRGLRAPRERTVERLKAALAEQPPPRAPELVAALHRAVMALLALAGGADAEDMLAQDFSAERPRNALWLQAARLRAQATYIATVELLIGNAALGRAIGCSRQAVKQARDDIEEERGDPAIDALLDRCARLVTGRTE
jgi:hypothetical protein